MVANSPFPIFLRIKEAAGIIGVTSTSLSHWLRDGIGPPFYRLNSKSIRIRKDELEEWLEKRKRNPHVQSDYRVTG